MRVWHFIVFPGLGMGAALLVARLVESFLAQAVVATTAYQAAKTGVISLGMASLIGWLAVGYRRQYEARLEARNKDLEGTRDFLRNIIESAGEAIITLDAEERITSWNAAAEGIFGWKAEEMLGHTYQRLLPDNRGIVEERRGLGERIRSGRIVRDYKTTRVHKNGTPIVVRVTWAPLENPSGSYAGAIAIVLDVTAESRLKQRLAEQDRLAAVGQLAAQIAHEVRNPLAGIRGAFEVILQAHPDPGIREEVGGEVLRQIDRLSRTVSDLLEFSKPETLSPEPTDLHELIDRVVSVFREDPAIHSVSLERVYAENVPTVFVDRGQMEQVIYNLLLNACQVMEHRGAITITTANEGPEVTIRVRDTGPGIPSDVAPRIFNPFFSTRAQGTGLGLSIVRKIVQAHGGTVEASSAAEGGAEFRIRLPATAEPRRRSAR